MLFARLSKFAPVLVLATLAACGSDGRTRYPLSGKVTFEGRPIPKGIIYFDPDVTKNDGPQGFALIENGTYDTRNQGQGTSGGWHQARLFACDGVVGPEAPMGRPMFPEYSWNVEVPAAESTLDFAITAAEVRQKSFQLTEP